MDARTIRRTFTEFFTDRDHRAMASAPLIAPGDPTLLFTSAGMVPFKPFFLGEATPPQPRLTSVQKCFRTTDIDETGDASHLTFFEMLGNFSLGEYFKEEAQAWAWELLTGVIGVPKDRLVCTVFTDDDDAFENWRKLGVPAERIFRYGEENYWYVGDVGPCGPSAELHYDLNPAGGEIRGPEQEQDRWLEIWNLVFMQFQRHPDGSKTPLPKQNIDTGAGLDRWAVMLQDKPDVYATDLFAPLIEYVAGRADRDYTAADDRERRALRVVVEHGRAMTFLIADGAIPGNEGRGYVLRRLIRRALYMAHTLGIRDPLLSGIAEQVRGQMGDVYPEINEQAALVEQVLDQEEERFVQTLATGHALLEEQTIPLKRRLSEVTAAAAPALRAATESEVPALAGAWLQQLEKGAARSGGLHNRRLAAITTEAAAAPARELAAGGSADLALARSEEALGRITGQEAFVLYDTYGVPREVTAEVATSAGLELDVEGFEAALAEQQERARADGTFRHDEAAALFAEIDGRSEFSGYAGIDDQGRVLAVIMKGERVQRAEAGAEVELVLDRTPFYAEGGGQVGDAGTLEAEGVAVEIADAQPRGDLIAHIGRVASGSVAPGDVLRARVDPARRLGVMRNHTATHLLHAALRGVLGDHARQAGSLVAADHLRFDYTQAEAPTAEQLREVQRLVNAKVRENIPVATQEMSYEDALETGAMAIFGEKYEADVRVVQICDPDPHVHDCFSKELCGGTHAPATGLIGSFVIQSESSIGAGLRRIEALTGEAAEAWLEQRVGELRAVADLLKTRPEDAPDRLRALQDEAQTLRRRLAAIEAQAGASSAAALADEPADVDGVPVVAGRVEVESADALRRAGDEVREKLGSGVIVLGALAAERPIFVAMVTDDLVARGLHAGNIVRDVAKLAGGGGGGKAEMAQAGGKDAGQIDTALATTADLVRGQLNPHD